MTSFAKLASVECSRRRKNMDGTYSTLNNLLCTPLAPVDAETRQTLGLSAPHVLYEVHLQNAPDIKKGDTLVVENTAYHIHDAAAWHWRPEEDTRLRLVIEDLSNNAV